MNKWILVLGTQDVPPGCPPISSFPGITGHIFHRPSPSGFDDWLGCSTDPQGEPMGIDFDPESRMNQPAVGSSHCGNSRPTASRPRTASPSTRTSAPSTVTFTTSNR
jgi:hypothetical protein